MNSANYLHLEADQLLGHVSNSLEKQNKDIKKLFNKK